MALTPRLDLRQSQSLVMTPQLQQAIKMLQLSNIELLDYVEQELEKNPLLERQEEVDGEDQEGGEAPDIAEKLPDEAVDALQDDNHIESINFNDTSNDSEAIRNDMDVEVDNEWNTDENSPTETAQANLAEPAFADNGPGGATDFNATLPNLEEILRDKITLR